MGGLVDSRWVCQWPVGGASWVGGIGLGVYRVQGMSDVGGSDTSRSNAGGWVRRWPVGGAPWVGGVDWSGVERLFQNP